MFRSLKLAFRFGLIFLLSVEVAAAWTLRKNESGIKVYTRKVEGSSIDQYKAEMIIRTDAKIVEDVLTDTAGAKEWIDRLKVSKTLKVISANEYVTYTLSDAPWPVKDRETISHSTTKRLKNGDLEYIAYARPKFLPPNDDFVRVQKLKARWLIQRLSKGRVRVLHEAHADPGGALPGWLANLFVVDIPFKTFQNMRSRVFRIAKKQCDRNKALC